MNSDLFYIIYMLGKQVLHVGSRDVHRHKPNEYLENFIFSKVSSSVCRITRCHSS